MATQCEAEGCLDPARHGISNEATDGEILVCRRCADELLARPGIYEVRHLD